jgi:hypothetical protein
MSWAAYRATLGWFHAKTHRLDAEVLWISNSKDSIITIQPKPRKDESKAFLAKFPALPPPKSGRFKSEVQHADYAVVAAP